MSKLYGNGTIKELVKGKKYRIALSGGKDPETGKYRRVQETFLGTERQAKLRIEQIRREFEMVDNLHSIGLNLKELEHHGITLDYVFLNDMNAKQVKDEYEQKLFEERTSITFAEWCENYLSTREKMAKRRESTLKRDRSLSKHLVSALGDVRVKDITPDMVNSFYGSMLDAGIGDTTIKQCHRLLKTVMKQAVINGIIVRNPVDGAETPRTPKPNRKWLGVDDANRLSNLCTSGTPTANKTAVYLGLALGARIGEVLGLQWEHVELKSDGNRPAYVYICQQYTEKKKLAPLKTDKDDNPVGRIVPIDAPTVAVLKAWKAVQRKQLNELGIEQGRKTPVITNQVGNFTSHTRFQRWWRSFCVANGFGQWLTEDGRKVVTLTPGDDAELYSDCVVLWRDSSGWPCDENGKRYSRTYPKPELKVKYDGLHFHSLRHTHFSMRMASGIDIVTAQALGGWQTPYMLLNVYSHPVAENVWASAGFMDKLAAMKTSEKASA